MSVETFTDDLGRVRQRQVTPDARRDGQVCRVVSLAPVVVEVLSTGQRARLFKRLASLDVSSVGVGDLVFVVAVEQGLIAIGEIV